jgi:GMP synthase (glutamine-hydrolysing)
MSAVATMALLGGVCAGTYCSFAGAASPSPLRRFTSGICPRRAGVAAPACFRHISASMEPRLKTKVQVMAAVRLCSLHAIPIVIARRGDEDAGTILIKLNQLERGVTVLTQTRTPQGDLAWLRATGEAPVDETAADAYITRQVQRDPDLWVVEIEDREGRQIFAGRIL